MSSRRPWRLVVAALSLFCAALAVSLAVWSYDPADLPGRVYPVNAAPKNLLGRSGALLARSLHDSLGFGVYLLTGFWLTMMMLLIMRRRWLRWGLRLSGWMLLIPAATVAATCWGWDVLPERGGSVGAWLTAQLQSTLPPLWLDVAIAVSAFVGVLTSFDFITLPALRTGGRFLWGMLLQRDSGPRPLPRRPLDRIPVTVAGTKSEEKPQQSITSVALTLPESRGGAKRTIPIHHHAQITDALEALPSPLVSRSAVAIQADPAVASDRERFADYELPPSVCWRTPSRSITPARRRSCVSGPFCSKRPSPTSASMSMSSASTRGRSSRSSRSPWKPACASTR